MQTVGRPCQLCGNKLVFSSEAAGCPACDVVWHQSCHSPSACPKCRNDPADYFPIQSIPQAGRSSWQGAFERLGEAARRFLFCCLGIAVVSCVAGLLHLLTQNFAVEMVGAAVIMLIPGFFFGDLLYEEGPSIHVYFGRKMLYIFLLILVPLLPGIILAINVTASGQVSRFWGIPLGAFFNALLAVLFLKVMHFINSRKSH